MCLRADWNRSAPSGHTWVMTVHNYKMLISPNSDPSQICDDITSHEELGWELFSFNSDMGMQEGYSDEIIWNALMRKPK
jgi:hypothetical protein